MTIKQLKSFLDSDDFILFATTGAKKKSNFIKYAIVIFIDFLFI